ncbi:hypothetical protein JW916_10965 [Candidatus Sumerlaeota bacterium]|nr:hypothetical protein [Candidatus Sumerlaeota bacterium]
MLLVLEIVCTYFMITYAISPKRSGWARIASSLMVVVTWFVPYGWIPGIVWGAICWSDSRAGGH